MTDLADVLRLEPVQQRVVNQIGQYLAERAGIALQPNMGGHVPQYATVFFDDRIEREQNFGHQRVQRERSPLRAGLVHRHLLEARHQIARTAQVAGDDLGCQSRFINKALKIRSTHAGVHELRKGLHSVLQRAGYRQTIANGCVELVRHTRHQRAQGRQLFRLYELVLGQLQGFQRVRQITVRGPQLSSALHHTGFQLHVHGLNFFA